MAADDWDEEDFPSTIGKDLLTAEFLVDSPTPLRPIGLKKITTPLGGR